MALIKRRLSFLVGGTSGMAETRIPDSRLARVNQCVRRRLNDDLEDMIRRACAGNDLEAATELLDLLKKWHERRASKFGRDRRVRSSDLERIREELDTLCMLRGTRPVTIDTKPRPGPGPVARAKRDRPRVV
jgi:hypothetical protein